MAGSLPWGVPKDWLSSHLSCLGSQWTAHRRGSTWIGTLCLGAGLGLVPIPSFFLISLRSMDLRNPAVPHSSASWVLAPELKDRKGVRGRPQGIALLLTPVLRLAQQPDPGYVLSGHRNQAVRGVCVCVCVLLTQLVSTSPEGESLVKRKGKGFDVGLSGGYLYQDSSWELIRDTVRGSVVCTAS